MEDNENPGDLIQAMSNRKKDWVLFPIEEKYMAALEIRSRVLQAAARWGKTGAAIRGTDREVVAAQELMLMLVPLANYLDGILATLGALKSGEALLSPPVLTERASPEGSQVVKAFPWGTVQAWLSLLGWSLSTEVDVPRRSTDHLPSRTPPGSDGEGELALVSGAGYNPVELLAACIYLAFSQGAVVGLALPREYAPFQVVFEYIMLPLAREAFFASFIVPDGNAVAELAALDGVDRLHLVGHTRETAGELVESLSKGVSISGDLPVRLTGSVHGPTPCIIVPGTWSDTQLKHHAFQLAETVGYAGSVGPYATRLVFLPADWDSTDRFIELVKLEFEIYKLPLALEPGLEARQKEFVEVYETSCWTANVRNISDLPADATAVPPWVVNVLDGVPASGSKEELALAKDPRAPFVTFIKVPANPSEDESAALTSYLSTVTSIVNERVKGSFGVSLIVQAGTEKLHKAAIGAAAEALDYGFVGINMHPSIGLLSAQTYWGAYAGPGADLTSDAGFRQTPVAGNSLMLRGAFKSVNRMPFESYLHQLPVRHHGTSLKTARTTSVSVVDGFRGFWRGLNDKTTLPGQE